MRGIYGGTFNPVHYAHLRTGLEVTETFALEALHWIPCRLPPHRQLPEVSSEHRWNMLKLAIGEVQEWIVDRRELDREGPSYMVDTLLSLRAEYPEQPLSLFIGADAFAGIEHWHRWQQLFDHAHLVVMTRPGHAKIQVPHALRNGLCRDRAMLTARRHGLVYFHDVTALDISATAIRQLIAEGRNPKFLLPDSVIDYIRQHHLYLPINSG